MQAVDFCARRQWPLWDIAAQATGNASHYSGAISGEGCLAVCSSDPAIGASAAAGDAGEFPGCQPLLAVVDHQVGMLLAADEEAG